MSHHRHRRDRPTNAADAARDARADELRAEIERRLARIRQAHPNAEAALAAFADPEFAGANGELPR